MAEMAFAKPFEPDLVNTSVGSVRSHFKASLSIKKFLRF